MGSKGDVKEFFGTFSGAGFWHAFCLACPASVRVFRNRTNSGVSEPYQSIVFYSVFYGFQR